MAVINYIGMAERIRIPSAAAARTNGQAVVENNWHGFVATKVALGEPYAMHVEGEFEITAIASSAIGDQVIINDTTFALTRAAAGTAAPGAGSRIFGKVTAIPGTGSPVGPATYPYVGPPVGKMWVKIGPQLI